MLTRKLLGAACALALGAGLAPAAAHAQTVMVGESAPQRVIVVPRDKSASFRLDQPASRIVVAQPEIARVVATGDRSFYVQGMEFGSTNLLVFGPGGRLQENIDIHVGYDAQGMQRDMAAAFPGEPIRVLPMADGVILTGEVSTTGVAERARKIAERYAPDAVTNNLRVRASEEVILEVRVLEATRTALQDIGFSGTLVGGSGGVVFGSTIGSALAGTTQPQALAQITGQIGDLSLDLRLQALEQKGIIRTLARPNLVAVSGEKASFLAGGEFPYPVPQDQNKITIEFRSYGVKLDFQPVVQENGFIRLMVAPEVSQLDNSTSVKLNGVTVPGLVTRRAATTVELRNGEALAIGGLLQRDYANDVRQLPGIGNIPVIGSLFRSAAWRRRETELVILVTPRIAARPDFEAAKTRVITGEEPSAVDVILNGKALDKPLPRRRGPLGGAE